jgi:hypothetical protein
VTGRLVRSGQLPEGWTRVSVSSAGVLAIVNGKLQLSTLDDPTSVAWSVPASTDSRVVATGTTPALLSVPAGYAVVSLTDGSVVAQLADDAVSGHPESVGGMVRLSDNRVVALDPPTPR